MLRIEKSSGVVVWTVDRPRAKNAVDHATLAALLDAARSASEDRDVRAAVLTGAGDTFVSGGDLRELRDHNAREDAERLSDAGFAVTSAFAELPFPVLAALPGPAIGGGAELALACDMRIADTRARIGFKQVRMGVTTAWGSAARLVALVGPSSAARLLFGGRALDAAEAERLGLVDEVTEDGHARDTAIAWAAEMAHGSPKAIAETKRLLRHALVTAHDVRAAERRAFVETWSGPDHREAVEAYFERRPAHWQPR